MDIHARRDLQLPLEARFEVHPACHAHELQACPGRQGQARDLRRDGPAWHTARRRRREADSGGARTRTPPGATLKVIVSRR
jgi:hypothetical protein